MIGSQRATGSGHALSGALSSMRLFMLSLMLLYGAFGLAFLVVPAHLSVTHTGAWFTDQGPASQLWGVSFLLAALLINAGLIFPEARRLAALGFLASIFTGGAWATAGLLITLFYGVDPTRPLFWLWVIFVVLFAQVHLAPRALPVREALDAMPRALSTPLRALAARQSHAPTPQNPLPTTPALPATMPTTRAATRKTAPAPLR